MIEPRRLIASMPGVDYRELPESDQCCGGGGTYQFMQPAISQAVGQRKAENVVTTKSDYVLTSATSCWLQLRAGLKKAGSATKALHLAEFFDMFNKIK